MYRDESPNAILPLPSVMDAAGVRADDKEAILQLIMEASGAYDIVKDSFKIFKNADTAMLIDGNLASIDFSLLCTRLQNCQCYWPPSIIAIACKECGHVFFGEPIVSLAFSR